MALRGPFLTEAHRPAPRAEGRACRAAAPALLLALGLSIAGWLAGYRQLGSGGRFVTLLVALASFGLLFLPGVRDRALTHRNVLALTALFVVVAVITPPRGSHDVWSYTMYGRMVTTHGVSPYTHAPSDFAGDGLFRLIAPEWRHAASVYGPAFVALAGTVTSLAGSSLLASRLLFQCGDALALAGILLVVGRRTRSPVALAFVGLCPLTVMTVNNGHNDLLVGLALLCGTLLLVDGRPRPAGVVLALGALVKLVLLLPIVALGIWAWRRGRPRDAVVCTKWVSAIVLGGYALAGGTTALAPLLHARDQHTGWNVWAFALHLLSGPRVPWDRVAATVGGLSLVTIALVAVFVVPAVMRGREHTVAEHGSGAAVAAGAVLLVYLLLAMYALPWYSAWVLPIVALVWRSRLAVIAALQAGVTLLASAAPVAGGGVASDLARVARVLAPIALVVCLVSLVRSARRGCLGAPLSRVPFADRSNQSS